MPYAVSIKLQGRSPTKCTWHIKLLTQFTILIGFSLLLNVALIFVSQSRLDFKCKPKILVNSIRFPLYCNFPLCDITWIQRHLVVSETLLVVITSTGKLMKLVRMTVEFRATHQSTAFDISTTIPLHIWRHKLVCAGKSCRILYLINKRKQSVIYTCVMTGL